ncbi:YdcF family protein [Bacteroidota bacterium]
MFFYLSKLSTFILMPYSQMVAWFLLALFLRNKVWKRRFLYLGIIYLVFFSNRFIANEVLLYWEIPPTPIASIEHEYTAGIVLGGVTNSDKEPRDRTYFYKGADRITHAVQLYKRGIIKKILVSGGSSKLINRDIKEAHNLQAFLLMCDIPEKDIIVEDEARNTHENANRSAEILKRDFPGEKHLVITSAFHLRRAMSCFRKTGLNVEGFSTDFYAKERRYTLDKFIIPDLSAFADWQMIIREWLGFFFYKIAGYI